MEERELLLRCCFLVMAADDEIDATESWLANRLAEELDVERPDLNAIRAEFHEQLSGVKELRRLAGELTPPDIVIRRCPTTTGADGRRAASTRRSPSPGHPTGHWEISTT